MARHALIVICTKSPTSGVRAFNADKAKNIGSRLQVALSSLGDQAFAWPGKKVPEVLINPTRGDFSNSLDNTNFEQDDDLLLFYLGHSYPVGVSGIAPTFDKSTIDQLKSNDFNWVLDNIYSQGIKNVFAILDTCHAGTATPQLAPYSDRLYCMMSATNGYARGKFTEYLLKALESESDEIRHLLHDPKRGGLTLEKLFEYAKAQASIEQNYKDPVSTGDLGSELLREISSEVFEGLRTSVPHTTQYYRAYSILGFVRDGNSTLSQVMAEVRANYAFVLNHSKPEAERYLSAEGVSRYIRFLSALKLVNSRHEPYSLTSEGKKAASELNYNKVMVEAILEHLFPPAVDLTKFKEIVWSLLESGTPPNPLNSGLHMRNNNLGRVVDPDNFKFAFRILPYTGVFMRANDALFPISS